jgi:DNA-binding transcriptional MerR regulator
VADQWTLPELVSEVAARIAALPPPKNGQVRAVPDDRTVRYYGTIGLLDRPLAMRGRTALYGRKHLAQVVAIKRLQHAEKSLADIQALWPTLDDATLARMSGVELPKRKARRDFWKADVETGVATEASEPPITRAPPVYEAPPVEVRIELAPNVFITLGVVDESVAISPADVRAIRASAAHLIAELANRGLTAHPPGGRGE